ncbi:hypothetical protein TAF16_2498 [Anoxybacillus flavithermus]|uniref:Uncharacterized protein n=1 Tax=Anoxybacillus flavithermus TaxID=33934 RepID=A0A178T6F1_9BACL|nr:hypothetical protein TAF16_2498 [Anoxybacillus flavithermus]
MNNIKIADYTTNIPTRSDKRILTVKGQYKMHLSFFMRF